MKRIGCFLITVALLLLLFSATALAAGISITDYAGSGETGYQDGAKLSAKFSQPYGIVLDKDGGLIVVDSYNNRIRKVKDDQVTTIAGFTDKTDTCGLPRGGFADGNALKAKFNKPRDAAIDSKGNIFITDTGNNAVRKIANGKVYTFAGTGKAGYKDGKGTVAQFNSPSDIAIDKKGVFYILDSGNQMIRKIDNYKVSTIAGMKADKIAGTNYMQGGFKDGADSRFNFPKGIDVTEDGTIFVPDTWNHRIRAIKPSGEVITVAGNGTPGRKDGTLAESMLNGPVDVLYNSGAIYISDTWNNCIRTMPVTIGNLIRIVDKNELIKGISFLPADDKIQVWVDKKNIAFPDVAPYLNSGKTVVPLRFICEAWGAQVDWNEASKQVEITKGGFHTNFSYDSKIVFNKDGRTMIQLRDLSESMGFYVVWVPEHRAVVISTDK